MKSQMSVFTYTRVYFHRFPLFVIHWEIYYLFNHINKQTISKPYTSSKVLQYFIGLWNLELFGVMQRLLVGFYCS